MPDGNGIDAPDVPPILSEINANDGLLGYFANADGFYGRPKHVEYLRVQRGDGGCVEALKIVGDANVPRGQLSWRSPPGYLDDPSWRFPIQLPLRDSPADGYWWSPGHMHDVSKLSPTRGLPPLYFPVPNLCAICGRWRGRPSSSTRFASSACHRPARGPTSSTGSARRMHWRRRGL